MPPQTSPVSRHIQKNKHSETRLPFPQFSPPTEDTPKNWVYSFLFYFFIVEQQKTRDLLEKSG